MEAGPESERRQRALLADRIEARASVIKSAWRERVEADLRRRHRDMGGTRLGNALGEYLLGLAGALRGEAPLVDAAMMAWHEAERRFGLTPVREGFDLDQLGRELILLRQSISEELLAQSAADEALIAPLTDAALSAAMSSYVHARDHASRRAQAEHGTFVTHELRNPLTTALVTVSQLRKNDHEVIPAERLELLERSLLRLRNLIDSVLAGERMELEDVVVERQNVTLGELAEEALRGAYEEARDRGLSLLVRLDADVAVHVDRSLTVSALRNLVENALTFTEEGRVELSSEVRGDEVVLHLLDNCEGVSSQMLTNAFEPFRSVHPRKPNPGFSLATARRAIEAQGGVIGAESTDHGCHVWLTLKKAHN
jgi:signal transduction histidine kinase